MSFISVALIVEDSTTQAQIVSRLIEAQGWMTQRCDTLRAAAEALAQMHFQALFLDVFVGSNNSLNNIDTFRQIAPHMPIIVMTAGSKKEDIEKTLSAARAAKADYVLKKPFTETDVKEIFDSAYAGLGRKRKRRHILIIDDNRIIRARAAEILESTGMRASTAESMEEAFENPEIAHVDLILSDVFMPGMGGLKGMRKIKRTWPSVKLIAMSAGLNEKVTDLDALNQARKIGADAQISKPFTSSDLSNLVRSLLGERSEVGTVESLTLEI